jgi:DNA processing protein
LTLVPGIGRARLENLLATFGSAEAALAASYAELCEVPRISPAAATAILDADPTSGHRILAQTTELGGVVLTPDDPAFPETLRSIPDVPMLLFGAGRLELLARPAVAIIGSRAHTRYGAEACRHFAGGLARAGLTVVSGMARGLDARAHQAALDVGGDTIGVLGNGLGVVYPAANRGLYDRVAREGCLVTEFPPGERPTAGSFPRRNRLISGLARLTLVIEARERSGALLTVTSAQDQGRAVLAVPGPITSPTSIGCNRLIQSGCKPALGLRDVLEEYGLAAELQTATSVPADLSTAERRTLDLLDAGAEHVDDVARGLGDSAAVVLATLTGLEIRGLVIQDPGKRFRRAPSVV